MLVWSYLWSVSSLMDSFASMCSWYVVMWDCTLIFFSVCLTVVCVWVLAGGCLCESSKFACQDVYLCVSLKESMTLPTCWFVLFFYLSSFLLFLLLLLFSQLHFLASIYLLLDFALNAVCRKALKFWISFLFKLTYVLTVLIFFAGAGNNSTSFLPYTKSC